MNDFNSKGGVVGAKELKPANAEWRISQTKDRLAGGYVKRHVPPPVPRQEMKPAYKLAYDFPEAAIRPVLEEMGNNAKGSYGEMQMDRYAIKQLGYERLDPPKAGQNKGMSQFSDKIGKGIDAVYQKPDGDFVIAESKYGTAGLGYAKSEETGERIRQMSSEWIAQNLIKSVDERTKDSIIEAGYEKFMFRANK